MLGLAMYFDNVSGGVHPPERTEAHIHAIYRKMFSLVKSMQKPDDIARALIVSFQGLFGADGAVLCHIFDDGARFVAAIGSLSHMEKAAFDLNNPVVKKFLMDRKAIILNRQGLREEFLSVTQYARFENMLLSPIAINGMPYGLIALVSDKADYFEARDAELIYQLSVFLSMLLENRAFELSENERRHCERVGNICRQIAPGLHSATIELIQTFASMRKSYASQKYNLMAEPLSEAVGNIEAMAKKVQDLRTLADICQDKDIKFTGIDLKNVVENVIDYNRSQIDEIAQLKVLISDELPSVYGDFTLIWQALHELIQNALRSMSRKTDGDKVLTIHVYPMASSATIEILDTGVGIEPSDARRIFEPFFTTWAPCRGLGLPRAMLNTLKMHGVLYYDANPGGGAIFRMSLPDELHVSQAEVF